MYPFRPLPGWFVGVEGALLHTHVSHNSGFLEGGSEPVNDLGLNLSPRGIVGYHFADGNALLASYRFLSGSGDTNIPNPAQASFTYNTLDLDYQGHIHGPWLFFTFQWQTGIRLDSIQYRADRTFIGPFQSNMPSVYHDWTADNFLGAGPHFGLNFAWYAGHTGLNLLARGDLGLLFGTDSHLFSARAEVGLGWVLPTRRWMRFESGYLLDAFSWDAHNFVNSGPFLRYEVGF